MKRAILILVAACLGSILLTGCECSCLEDETANTQSTTLNARPAW